MASVASEITFIVPGQAQAVAASRSLSRASVRASVRVGTERGTGEPVRVVARPGEDVVVLSVAQRADARPSPRRCARPDAGAERDDDA